MQKQGKICLCLIRGCDLTDETKKFLFTSFRDLHYNDQSLVLISNMTLGAPAERTMAVEESRKQVAIHFTLSIDGSKLPTCKKNLMDVYKITETRIRTLKDKLLNGVIIPVDRRGTHQYRPYFIAPEIRQAVIGHIKLFPTYESHYARNQGEPIRLYFHPELNISIMHRLFKENQTGRNLPTVQEWCYRDIFHTDFKLLLTKPKQDCCDLCDKLTAKHLATGNPEFLELRDEHHFKGYYKKYFYANKKPDSMKMKNIYRIFQLNPHMMPTMKTKY